ncbi:MAG: elongation factor P, partial [Spirochaetaceae bacterium]|nr:elongation factor P [Spirochaetaceae bacterium]
MLMTADIRGGTVFKNGSDVVVVQRMLGIKGGRNGQVKRLRVKNILTGATSELGLDMGEKFEDVSLDYHKVRLSYIDGDNWIFMDQE